MSNLFTISLDESTFKMIKLFAKKQYPDLGKDEALKLFVQNTLISVYTDFQPQDIKYKAINQPSESFFRALHFNINKSQVIKLIEYLQRSHTNDLQQAIRIKLLKLNSKLDITNDLVQSSF